MKTTTNNVRNNEAVLGRTDYYRLNPNQIKVLDGWNPRLSFDAQKLEELKESIKENGVLVPLRVKMNNDGEFTLIDGERRLRATLLAISEGAEIVSVPAIVERKTMNEIDATILALTANQGEPLTMMEEANAIKKLQNYGLKPEEIAKKLGKSVPTVYNRLSLLDASPELIEQMENGEVSFTDVKKIVNESDGIESQKEKLEEVKAKKAARKAAGTKKPGKKAFVDLVTEMVEWLQALNVENVQQVNELIERANNLLDNEE
jgi:ParB family transcriptional regulator, chromosome partitioning protein